MAKFAPVAPPEMLLSLATHNALGDYHLLLAHDVADKPGQYQDAFWKSRHDKRYIIMDNSVIELGEPVDFATMAIACDAIPPNVIALPDMIGDTDLTISMSQLGAETWDELKIPYMVIPQGRTLEEFKACAEELATIPNVKAWGIPRHATGKLGTRLDLVSYCYRIRPYFDVHLLGFSDDLSDDLMCARVPIVKGIDSAVPIRLGLHNITLTKDLADHPPRGDYWETATEANDLVLLNLVNIRRWIA